MRTLLVRLMVFAAFGLMAPGTAQAQMIAQRYIQTIDVKVLNSRSVVVGRIADVKGSGSISVVSIKPEDVLKGSVEDAVRRELKYSEVHPIFRTLDDVFQRKQRVLVTDDDFIYLDAKQLAIPTAKGTVLTTPDKVIDYAREVLTSKPGSDHVETFSIPLPQDWDYLSEPFSLDLVSFASWRPAPLVTVPVNMVEKMVMRGRLGALDQTKLSKAASLKDLEFDLNGVSDPQLETIGRITTLTRLVIRGQEITDSGLKYLQALTNLQELDLSLSLVTDTGLSQIVKLPRLNRLVLAETQLSDAGLMTLSRSSNLKSINVTLTRTTSEGVNNALKTRPDLQIERSLGAGWISADRLAANAFRGDLEAVRSNLDAVSPSGWDQSGNHALFYAVDQGHPEIVELLLDRLARVDIQNIRQNTALHWAAQRGNASMIKLLLSRGADTSRFDLDGNTALHFAAQNGSADAVRLLLEAGASPTARNRNGATPVELATGFAKDLLLKRK